MLLTHEQKQSNRFRNRVAAHLLRRYKIGYPPVLEDRVSRWSYLDAVLWDSDGEPTDGNEANAKHFNRFCIRVGIDLSLP
ncbi:hypothetical protein [Microcystis phage Mvi-JY20]|uniref:Uncharacterized protein n=1 Tax=Microcystis phage Mvi-JY20 TaxID=3128146 RepID=A0AAX4QFS1_9CAUD